MITVRIDTTGDDEANRRFREAIRRAARVQEPGTAVQEALGATERPDACPGKGPRSRRRWSRAVDRAVWTATGAATGFGLALIAIGVFIPWELL